MTIIGEILHKLSHCIDWTRRKVYPFDWCYMMYVVDKAASATPKLGYYQKTQRYRKILLLSNISVQYLNIEYLGFACAVNMGCE